MNQMAFVKSLFLFHCYIMKEKSYNIYVIGENKKKTFDFFFVFETGHNCILSFLHVTCSLTPRCKETCREDSWQQLRRRTFS